MIWCRVMYLQTLLWDTSLLCWQSVLFATVVECAATHLFEGNRSFCSCLFVCELVVFSPAQFMSAYVRVRFCTLLTNAVCKCEGSGELLNILCKAKRHRRCPPFWIHHMLFLDERCDFVILDSRVWSVNDKRCRCTCHITGTCFVLCLVFRNCTVELVCLVCSHHAFDGDSFHVLLNACYCCVRRFSWCRELAWAFVRSLIPCAGFVLHNVNGKCS